MELEAGYKQTEIGVIPDDWEVKMLGEIADFTNGKPNEQNVVVNGKFLLVTLDSINIRGELKASHKQTNSFDDSLRAGDIVTVLSDIAHGNLLGLCGVIPLDHKYVLNQRMGRIRVNSGYDPSFIRLKVNRQQNHFKTRGQGTSQRHIYRRDFDCLKISMPSSVTEQKAIADALSDVDALINSLEALLTKKRNIKIGVMQELLTGRTRLPGFSGEWEIFQLLDVADCLDHLRVPLNESERLNRDGDYPYCGANGILGFIDDYLIEGDTVLIAEDGGYFDEYALRPIAYQMSGKYWVNNHAHVLKAKSKFDNGFLYFSLVNKDVTKYLASGTRAKLNKSEMWKIEVFAPISRSEQTAIAGMLSDIDLEIEAVEKRLAKTRDLKQGMAQELLTGRTRLK